MASEIYSRVSPDDVARRFRDERVEPDLGPRGAPRVTTQRRKPLQAGEILAPSRRRDAAKAPVGMLVHIVSVGLVAATIIGVFFGTGFFLLVSPGSERITDQYPPHVYGNGAERGRQAVLVSHLAAVNVLPGSPLNQRPAVDEAVPLAQSTAVQEFPPARPNGDPPVAASVPEQASDSVPPRRHRRTHLRSSRRSPYFLPVRRPAQPATATMPTLTQHRNIRVPHSTRGVPRHNATAIALFWRDVHRS
jgi:hypothetical protein